MAQRSQGEQMGKRLSSGKRNTTASAKDTKLLWIVIVLLALLVAGGLGACSVDICHLGMCV